MISIAIFFFELLHHRKNFTVCKRYKWFGAVAYKFECLCQTLAIVSVDGVWTLQVNRPEVGNVCNEFICSLVGRAPALVSLQLFKMLFNFESLHCNGVGQLAMAVGQFE